MKNNYRTFPFDTDGAVIWFPRDIIQWETEYKGSMQVYLFLSLMRTGNMFSAVKIRDMCDFAGFSYQTNITKTIKKVNAILAYLSAQGVIRDTVVVSSITETLYIPLNPGFFRMGATEGISFRSITLTDYELLRNHKSKKDDKYKSSFSTLLLVYLYLKTRIYLRSVNATAAEREAHPMASAMTFLNIATGLNKNSSNYIVSACHILKQLNLIYFSDTIKAVINKTYPPVNLKIIFVEKKAADTVRSDWQLEYDAAYWKYINDTALYYAERGTPIDFHKDNYPMEVLEYMQSKKLQKTQANPDKLSDTEHDDYSELY